MLSNWLHTVRKLTQRQDGATMVEYGLVGFLIAVACVLAVAEVGLDTHAMFQQVVIAFP